MSDGNNNSVSVAYFDSLPQKFSEGDADALLAFGRHLHWGYWSDPIGYSDMKGYKTFKISRCLNEH
ncbi:hypothetical protein ANSO36C_63220 (plasmid) [Nostoc cf. commune SO-36]|uniref:Uncharacterized protein n=1 Tax=Nostoc cf. commune SO-36 TaxID=449208 RepID=A0ABM7ZB65_NOSCO|nr:hypothetical protein ANSO36C_63220 [Nostoc cf. commune SO-36]